MTAYPQNIQTPFGQPGQSADSAKYLIPRSKFVRPSIRVAPSGPEFEWPMGTEGFRISGQVGTAQHLYLGDNAPVVQVVHRDARTLQLSGMFMGKTAAQNLRDLIEVITAPIPQGYWILRLPAAIFPKEQTVVVETYEFDHPEEERNDSFSYAVSMARTGVGGLVPGESGISTGNTVGNTATGEPKGETNKTFTTRAGADTLRLVATTVYGDPSRWREIYNKNKTFFDKLKQPLAQLQYSQLDRGIKLNV